MSLLPNSLVKSSLSAHSWLGLSVAAVLYLVCLSGTLSVFYLDMERWEQPRAEEYRTFDPEVMEAAFNDYLRTTELTPHMYMVFPSAEIPRIKFASEESGVYINQDGSTGNPALDDWSHLLTDLHINLHLPSSVGIILVSMSGVMLLALIISGLLAHPSLFRDAFSWRRGSRRTGITDLHNRLSVWGLPFHLMMAITGAYFGLVGLIIVIAAQAFYGGDRQALVEQFFAGDPEVEDQPTDVNITTALEYIRADMPQGIPLFLTLHDMDTDQRFQEYYIENPRSLVYSENYRFDMAGNFIERIHSSEADVPQRVLRSVYRLHFGDFGGLGTRCLYLLLGLALTVSCASGIQIWLERRRYYGFPDRVWSAIVWGSPLALACVALAGTVAGVTSVLMFWGLLCAAVLTSALPIQARQFRLLLTGLLLAAVLLLPLAHSVRFGIEPAMTAGGFINAMLLATAVLLGIRLISSWQNR